MADKTKADQFNAYKNASYSGPSNLQDYNKGSNWSELQSKLGQAKTAKSNTETEEGRRELIKSLAPGQGQTQGTLTFDNLLLQSNPNSAKMLKSAGSSLGDIDNRLAQANQAAAQQAQSVAAANKAVADRARQSLNQGRDSLMSSLSEREAAADKQQQDAYQAIRDAFSGGKVNFSMLESLGLPTGVDNYGIDPTSYLSRVDSANAGSLATAEDRARQKALQSLAGQEDFANFIPAESASMGTGFDFDSNRFLQDIGQKESAYKSTVNPLLSEKAELENILASAKNAGATRTTARMTIENEHRKKRINEINSILASLADQYSANSRIGTAAPVEPGQFFSKPQMWKI